MYSDYDRAATGSAVIKIIGVGGGGNNAVNRMIESAVIDSVEYIAVNTDKQALMLSKAPTKIVIGEAMTKGLGAGSNPDVGERAAEETLSELEAVIEGTDLLFITAGMGGGTGTGAAPVIAKIAREKGILTVAVITKPFTFEGRRREENAKRGIANLQKYVDTLVIIPNDKLLQVLPANTSMLDAFAVADDTLRQGVRGIVDLITTPSLINLDFADVYTIMKDQGLAHMGIGRAKDENRMIEAVRQAVSSPLLETTIEGAKGVLLNVTGGRDMTMEEVNEAAKLVQGVIDYSANIIFGTTIDESISNEVVVTIIATGFTGGPVQIEEPEEEKEPAVKPGIQFNNINRANTAESAPSFQGFQNDVNNVKPVQQPVEEKRPFYNEPVREEPKKGRELPAFMQKLFGRKD